MKGNLNSLNEIYEFLDEILGSFIPGIYFCSFFITTIWTFIKFCSNTKIEISENIFILILFIIHHNQRICLGTFSRRTRSLAHHCSKEFPIIKKNVPWHILAPSAVACDKLPHRASAHRWQVVPFCVLGSSNGIS